MKETPTGGLDKAKSYAREYRQNNHAEIYLARKTGLSIPDIRKIINDGGYLAVYPIGNSNRPEKYLDYDPPWGESKPDLQDFGEIEKAAVNYFLGCKKPKEAAKCAGVSERTLKSWYHHGLPFIKVNDRLTLIEGQDLKAFMESRKQQIKPKADKVAELLQKTIGK